MFKYEISMAFGVLCESIKKQLNDKGLDLTDEDCERFESIRKSIHVLKFGSYINDSTASKAFQKLLNSITKKLKPLEVVGSEDAK